MLKPAILFPDAVAWAVTYLGPALAARVEPFADDVTVRSQAPREDATDPAPVPGRVVTIRDDGGPDRDLTKVNSLGVNVWADTEEEAGDLARLVAALLRAGVGTGALVAHLGANGPYPIPDESGHHWFLSADLLFRGSSL
jgi:hypothetical protein